MSYKSPQVKPGTTRIPNNKNTNKTGRGDMTRQGNPIAKPGGASDVDSTHVKSLGKSPSKGKPRVWNPPPLQRRGYSRVQQYPDMPVDDAMVAPDGTRRLKKT